MFIETGQLGASLRAGPRHRATRRPFCSHWASTSLPGLVAQRPSDEAAERGAHRHHKRMPHEDVQRLKIRAVELQHRQTRKPRQRTDRQAGPATRSQYSSVTAAAVCSISRFRCRAHRSDVTVSHDRKWLAVIYSAGGGAHVGVFGIDPYGDLTPVATSSSVGVTAFNGVAISQQDVLCRQAARRACSRRRNCRLTYAVKQRAMSATKDEIDSGLEAGEAVYPTKEPTRRRLRSAGHSPGG